MIRSYNQILRDVGDAVDYVRAHGGIMPDNFVAEQAAAGSEMAELSDAASVNEHLPKELPPCRPDTVRAVTVEELEMAYQALGYIHGGIDQHKIDKDIWHEIGHKRRVDVIGFAYSGFGLTVTSSIVQRTWWRKLVSFSWTPYTEQAGPIRDVTKLAVAAIVAGPHSSVGDKAHLKAMGYQGRADVARRIVTASQPHLALLPLPEGFDH